MRVVVETARRRFSGVDQNEALEGLQPVEASIGRMRRRAPLGLGARQNEVDQHPVFLERIVEQRQPAVAMPKKTHHRRHSLDGIFERGRDLDLRRPQHRARVDQILQHLQLQRRAARQMPAIREDLNRQLALEALSTLAKRGSKPPSTTMPAIRPLSARTRPAPAASQDAVRAK